MANSVVKFVRLSSEAVKPTRGSEKAAGFDLYSTQSCWIPSGGQDVISTGLKVCLPDNTYGRVAALSGLSVHHKIVINAGVVDSDYTGEVKVVMMNLGNNAFLIKKGDRIAQLIVERIFLPDWIEVESLEETKRGESGFNSGKPQ